MVRRNKGLVGVALSVFSACCFGTVAPLAKVAYDEGAEALPLLGVRFLTAAIFLAVFHALKKKSLLVERARLVQLLLLGGLGYAFEASLFFVALELAPAGIVSLVFFSYPLITNILATVLGIEPMRRSTAVALALGSVGVASIFGIGGINLAGPLFALAAAAAVAVYFLAASVYMKGIEASVGAMWTATGAAVSLIVISLATQQAFPMDALPAATALGAVTAVAFTSLYAAIALIGSPRTAVAQMFEPVVTVLLAAVFLGEALSLRIGIGAALIVSSLPVLASTGHKERIPPPADSL